MDIGDNRAAVLRDLISKWESLEQEACVYKEKISEAKDELKDRDLPVAVLIKTAKTDEKKRKKERENRLVAGAILGKSVVAEEVTPDISTAGIDEEGCNEVSELVQDILDFENEIAAVRDQINMVKKKVKEEEFSITVVGVMVQHRVYPDKKDAYYETSSLLAAYEKALV